jgi:aspartyl protease family protein
MLCLIWILSFAVSQPALAAGQVRVLALFPGKAMLEIDGKREVLADGETGRQGVVLVRATPLQVVVRVDGREQTLTVGTSVNAEYERVVHRELRVLRDNSGSYFTSGLINGQPVQFLVDTGATSVAMGEQQARRLGIPYLVTGTPLAVRTAAGTARAWEVDLDSLKFSHFTLQRVRAFVVEGDTASRVLLGMNVLREFDMQQRDNLLILRRKH